VLFFNLLLHSCNYNKHVESLLPGSLCIIAVLNSERCSQF